MRISKQDLIQLLFLFFLVRGLIHVTGYLGRVAFMNEITLTNGKYLSHPNNISIDIWDRWDSSFYRGIARKGYSWEPNNPGVYYNVVFFPLYPLLIAGVTFFTCGDMTIAGMIVSFFALLGAAIMLYKMALFELHDKEAANRAVLYLLIFPSSFFFSAVYTESLFLFLSLSSIYFARQRKWWWCGLFGALTSATRLVGLLTYMVAMIEWMRSAEFDLKKIWKIEMWQQFVKSPKAWSGLLPIHGIFAGLFAFMLHLQIKFGDPFAFFHGQQAWRSSGITNPFSIVQSTFEQIYQSILMGTPIQWLLTLELFFVVATLVAAVLIWWKFNESYALYTLASIFIPLSTFSTMSAVRYVVVIFPIYLLLAKLGKNKVIHQTLVIGFSMLLAVLMTVFVNWGFVG